MSITIGTVNKDGTGSTLAITVPMHAEHTAATTTSSHTGARWGFFKRATFTYNDTTGDVVSTGAFAYYHWKSGDQIELEHASVNGGVAQLIDIVSKVDNDTVRIATSYHTGNLTGVAAYVGIEPLGDLVYKWDCVGASTYTNTDPDPTGLRSSTIDPTRWYGPHTVCPHYETAGTYSIVLTVNDYANSESATKTITVTATANTWTTRYLDPAGDDANLGTSAGVGNAWQGWKKGYEWAVGASDRELILATGTYPDMTANVSTHGATTGPHYIHHDGVGSKPIIPTVTFGAMQTNGTGSLINFRMVGIKFTKTGSGSSQFALKADAKDSLILRCEIAFSGVNSQGASFSTSRDSARTAWVDGIIDGTTDAIFSYYTPGDTASEVAGQCIVASRFTGTGSVVRVSAYRAVFAYNDFTQIINASGSGPNLRFTSGIAGMGESVLWRCSLPSTNPVAADCLLISTDGQTSAGKYIIDACYFESGTGGAAHYQNVVSNELTYNDTVFRNNMFVGGTTLYHNQNNFTRRLRWINNSIYQSDTNSKGLRAGISTDGGVDDLSCLNNIFSSTGAAATTDYAISNVGNSGAPDRESTFIDYNLFHLTDAVTSPQLAIVRTWTTAASSTAATYTDGAGATRTLTEVGAWAGYTHASGSRAQPTGVVPQNANNTIRLIGSKTSNDIIVIGGAAGSGWGQDYASVPCNAQTAADTNVAQLSNWTAIKAAETHNLGGVGASATDPLFIDPATGNLQLQATSPARSVGLALPFNRFDYRGAERYTGSGEMADMGAIAYATTGMMVAGRGRGRGRRRGNTWP